MRRGERAAHADQQGYTFVAVLALLAIFALGLTVAGPRWSDAAQREREQELLRLGVLYATAIQQYRERSPGTLKTLPASLEDLLADHRFVGTTRHLRKLYPDPIEPTRPWGLIQDPDGRILGVYSQSERAPLAQGALQLGPLKLAPATRYAEWKFTLVSDPR